MFYSDCVFVLFLICSVVKNFLVNVMSMWCEFPFGVVKAEFFLLILGVDIKVEWSASERSGEGVM